MNRESFISLQNVEKFFGKVHAIHDVTMDIRQGEFFSLLGASGSGKTTLLRMLAGFETPTAGEIFIDRQPMSDVPPHHRPVNMVFQNYAIFPHLNVRDNIAYGLRKLKLTRTQRRDRAEEMLDLIKLPGYGDRKANQLSGGQQQRVALARSLILKPKVLLLDEPLGALDKQLREQMQLELRALQRQVGITFVFVTHDQEEALTLSDRIAVMSGGSAKQIDTPTGLYETPRSREVASFIGTMNFFDGQVTQCGEERLVVDTEGLGTLSVPKPHMPVRAGERVQVAIRPEKIAISDVSPKEGVHAVAGHLKDAAYLGERSHFYVALNGIDKPIAVSSQNTTRAVTSEDTSRTVWLSWNPDAAVVLVAE